jgi:hypothetical protein
MGTVNQGFSSGINIAFAENEYFSAKSEQLNFLGINSTPYTVLKPKTSVINVHGDMYWSNLGDKSEVPEVFVIEKQLEYGAWAAQLASILQQGGQLGGQILQQGGNVDSFVQLYAAKETGFYYNLPWLLKGGDSIRSIENQWSKVKGIGETLMEMAPSTKGSIGDIIGAGIGAAIGAFTPGFGFEETYQYNTTTPQTLTISFPLYNTIDVKSALRHFNFVNLFTFQNLKTRTSLMSYIPPKIYTVDAYSLGGVYMAAAYVSNFKVDSIGTTRKITEWGLWGNAGVIIPEAYKVTITFTDLLSQSSNVFAGALGGTKVQVTNNNVQAIIDGFKNKAATVVQPIVQGLFGNNPNAQTGTPSWNNANGINNGQGPVRTP